jgi:hypothetical protein
MIDLWAQNRRSAANIQTICRSHTDIVLGHSVVLVPTKVKDNQTSIIPTSFLDANPLLQSVKQ